MFDSIVSSSKELASQVVHLHRLHRLQKASKQSKKQTAASAKRPPTQPPPKSQRFMVHGWRWHHLAILRDLTRLQTTATAKSKKLCAPAAHNDHRKHFQTTWRYILHDNWRLHNSVERTLFLPWVLAHARPNDIALTSAARAISTERDRLVRRTDCLSARVDDWVTVRTTADCRAGLTDVLAGMSAVQHAAERLFVASEAVLIPAVLATFDERQQARFNQRVLGRISGTQARTSLVFFADALDRSRFVVATPQDCIDFRHAVPAPVRRLALPFWRSKLVADKIRFLVDD